MGSGFSSITGRSRPGASKAGRGSPPAAVAAAALLLVLAAVPPAPAGKELLDFRHERLDLPGPPSRVVAADLNADGRVDLAVVVAYTEIEEIGGVRIENLVQIATVIPALFDRRALRVYLATAAGSYEPAGAMDLPPSVLHLEAAGALGVVALTDDGVSQLVLEDGPALRPLLRDPPVLAGTGAFLASLRLVHDLDGDGHADLLLPSRTGLAVYRGDGRRLLPEPAARIPVARRERRAASHLRRRYPIPEVREIDGDGLPDLLFPDGYGERGRRGPHVLLGAGGGRFRPLRDEPRDCHDQGTDLRMARDDPGADPWPRDLAALRDLDGDGRAEAVFAVERPRGDSLRKELKDAKRPIFRYRFHRLDDSLDVAARPYFEMTALGHSLSVDQSDLEELPFRVEQFDDLDGDGREELVTITLDFSLFQVLKVLTTRRIGIGVDFHVFAQRPGGGFREVPDLDLSEKLRFDLNRLTLGRLAHFAGDFDGDGRKDFVHLGRGRKVTLHTGRPGPRFPRDPDAVIRLEEEPVSLDLVRIEDLDGDGRSDLRITRPLYIDDPDLTAPVRLDLYLSGGPS